MIDIGHIGHSACFTRTPKAGGGARHELCSVRRWHFLSYHWSESMTDVAIKRAVSLPGAAVRERLRTLDDSAVVTAFLGGEERAFQELVERYQTRLLNFVFRTIGDREKAEDLVQEVFIRVHRHLHRFDRSKKFSTWIYTIASNLAKNELRNRSRNPLVLFQ